jgi:hypothetical protein
VRPCQPLARGSNSSPPQLGDAAEVATDSLAQAPAEPAIARRLGLVSSASKVPRRRKALNPAASIIRCELQCLVN